MNPESAGTSGGFSALHPAAIALLFLAALLIWFLPRRYMLIPFLFATILIPMEQQIVIAGLHVMVLRMVLLCSWIPVVVRIARGQRLVQNGWKALDTVFVCWVLSSVVVYTLLWGNSEAFVNRLGLLYNAFGIYFLLRHALRDGEDVRRLVRTLAVLCAIVAVLMVVEQVSGRNLLSLFGLPGQAEVRLGRIRSQGPFMHSIIAGTCGALMVPIFIGLGWTSRESRAYAIVGVVAGTVMTITSASSTPVGAYLAALVGLCLWPLRQYMRAIRWAVVSVVVMLHLVMKAPVWALIARVDFAGGSTGSHRFMLVDNFIRRFGEWWLIGTRDNAQWGFDMFDTVNWYVQSGIYGGVIGLGLSIALLVYGFKAVGKFLRVRAADKGDKRFAWCLGSALFACAVAFFGITFFDQSIVIWYALFAMILTTTSAPAASPADVKAMTISVETRTDRKALDTMPWNRPSVRGSSKGHSGAGRLTY